MGCLSILSSRPACIAVPRAHHVQRDRKSVGRALRQMGMTDRCPDRAPGRGREQWIFAVPIYLLGGTLFVCSIFTQWDLLSNLAFKVFEGGLAIREALSRIPVGRS